MHRLFYSDHGYRRQVNSWSAADVRGPDGLLRHGTVVDVRPDGLTVDFGCERQLVKYGEAFSFWRDDFSADKLRPGCVAEVLLRVDRTRPWIWRPATVVTADIADRVLALVDVQLGGVERREVVPFQQIRPPPSPTTLQSRVLQPDAFVVTSIRPLPADIAALSPTQSLLWKRFCQHLSFMDIGWPVLVSSSEMLFLHRKELCSGHRENMSQLLIRGAKYSLQTSIEMGVMGVDNGDRCGLPSSCGSFEVAKSAEDTEWTLQNMPRHVLAEVLTHLEAIEFASQRRVCRAFDDLFSVTMSNEIRLNYRQCSQCRLASSCGCSTLYRQYRLCASLWNCVTPATRRITLTNGGPEFLTSVLQTVGICGQLGKCIAGRPVLVVAAHCKMGMELLFANRDDLVVWMGGGWCKLLLEQCRMVYPHGLRISGALTSSSLPENLWELMESGVPAFDVQGTRQWIALTVQGVLADRDGITVDLGALVSHDPRQTNAYAGCYWEDDTLAALDVSKLSRLALYALNLRWSRSLFNELPFAQLEG